MNNFNIFLILMIINNFYIDYVKTQFTSTSRLSSSTRPPVVCPASENICKNNGICLINNNSNKLCSKFEFLIFFEFTISILRMSSRIFRSFL
jgi:hypothetical protein